MNSQTGTCSKDALAFIGQRNRPIGQNGAERPLPCCLLEVDASDAYAPDFNPDPKLFAKLEDDDKNKIVAIASLINNLIYMANEIVNDHLKKGT